MNKAKDLVEGEGFTVLFVLEENGGNYCFLCADEDGNKMQVCVIDGEIMIEPT